ncbi:MAG: hypothetical protein JXB85_17275, partial [Anaerolineales bacterium]|nr:hypothetical protein [Anaerolineales bacterium]
SDGSPGDLGTRTASITLDPGEHVTCTFTNTRRGTITIVKDAYPDDPQDFTFLRSFGANFSLDDDADATLPNTITFLNVPAGSHTVTENTVVNWTLTGLSCSDPTGGSSVNLGGRTATIVLDSGETVICTFLNSYNPYPNIGIGPGDGNTTPIPANNSITLALSTPIYAHGGNEWDLIYFEMYNAGCGGICMDFVTIQISADGSLWQTVLAYGGSQYSNSSLNGFPEVDDQSIPEAALELSPYMIHATGVGIDIDALSLPLVNYYYIRITSPLGDNDGVCDVDSILIVP